MFLLPETRAYLAHALPAKDSLGVVIEGSLVGQRELFLHGAWWENQDIHQFHEPVIEGKSNLPVPDAAGQLEFYLGDEGGNWYDFYYEDNYRDSGLGRKRLRNTEGDLPKVVRAALAHGEGVSIEFKPFISPEKNKKNHKIWEIFRTVAAFANTHGGQIFLGVTDDCSLAGIDEKLGEWSDEEPTAVVCERYFGALRSRIRDAIEGEPELGFFQAVVDGHRIGIIEVKPHDGNPVSIFQDDRLYVRRGSNNAKAKPQDWEEIIRKTAPYTS